MYATHVAFASDTYAQNAVGRLRPTQGRNGASEAAAGCPAICGPPVQRQPYPMRRGVQPNHLRGWTFIREGSALSDATSSPTVAVTGPQ